MTSAVSVRGVSKAFAGIQALSDIHLEIPQGSFLGLLGPNGAGKSTLIGILAGLVRPDSGQVSIMGHDVRHAFQQARRALGLVPQELIDEPFFSIRDLLRLQAGYFGLGRAQWSWIDELLQRLGLWDKRDQSMPQLSGGMKRRVLIALALVHKPAVVVLDEPTAGVDIELRLGLWDFIRELHAQGHTIILTTHYLEEAEALCERIAILRQGQILALEETQTLIAAHPYEYVELTLSQPPVSLPEVLAKRLHRQQGNRLVLRLARGSERAALTDWLTQAGLVLEEMRYLQASLEDVFRSLMRTEESV